MLKLYYAETATTVVGSDAPHYAWEIHGKGNCELAHEDFTEQLDHWEDVSTTLEPLAELINRLVAEGIRGYPVRSRFTICHCAVNTSRRSRR